MIKVDLKGNSKEFEAGVTAAEVAKSIGMGLYKSACAARIDGEACDLRTPLEKDCALEILTFDDPEGKHAFWHTAAHVMAQAVQKTAGITTSRPGGRCPPPTLRPLRPR